MTHIDLFVRRLPAVAALAFVAMLAGCGGGGADGGGVYGGGGVVVVASPPPVIALAIVLTRTGPETVQVDWSDDPFVDSFTVERSGFAFVNVRSTTLIDNSVIYGQSYCYRVSGYDRVGNLVAASNQACITIL